jgi:hypothetical protein
VTQYEFIGDSAQVFRAGKILLEEKIIRRKKEAFFETAEIISATIAVKCLGTRCESGTVAPL